MYYILLSGGGTDDHRLIIIFDTRRMYVGLGLVLDFS